MCRDCTHRGHLFSACSGLMHRHGGMQEADTRRYTFLCTHMRRELLRACDLELGGGTDVLERSSAVWLIDTTEEAQRPLLPPPLLLPSPPVSLKSTIRAGVKALPIVVKLLLMGVVDDAACMWRLGCSMPAGHCSVAI